MKWWASPRQIGLGIIAGILSLALTATAYLFFVQTPTSSRREILSAILLFLVLCPTNYAVLNNFLLPRFRPQRVLQSILILLFSALCGIVTTLVIQPPTLIRLLPIHTLEISIPTSSARLDGNGDVTLNWFTTSLGDVSFNQIRTEGKWYINGEGLQDQGNDSATLRWQGKSGTKADQYFTERSNLDGVSILWDNSPLDTGEINPVNGLISFRQNFPIPRGSKYLANLRVGFPFPAFSSLVLPILSTCIL